MALTRPTNLLLLILLVSSALILGAYGFEYIGGLKPCALCWSQRYAHFAALAFAVFGFFGPKGGLFSEDWRPVFLLGAVAALLAGAYYAGFHTGVELKWWPGFAACEGAGGGDLSFGDLAGAFETNVPRCDEVPWALFGISMAGHNLIISAGIGALALFGLARTDA